MPDGDGRAFSLLTGISSQLGWGGAEMPWMFREQILRGFRVWGRNYLAKLVRGVGNEDGATPGDFQGYFTLPWAGEGT